MMSICEKTTFFVKKQFSEKVENCDILMFKNVKSSVSKMCGFSTLHGPYISILCTMLEKCSLKAPFSGKQQDKSRIRDHFFSSSAKLLKKSMIIDTTHEIA